VVYESVYLALAGQLRAAADTVATRMKLTPAMIGKLHGSVVTDNLALRADLERSDYVDKQMAYADYQHVYVAMLHDVLGGMGIHDSLYSYESVRLNDVSLILRDITMQGAAECYILQRVLHPAMYSHFVPNGTIGGGLFNGTSLWERSDFPDTKAFSAFFDYSAAESDFLEIEMHGFMQQAAALSVMHYTPEVNVKYTSLSDNLGERVHPVFTHYRTTPLRLSEAAPSTSYFCVSPVFFFSAPLATKWSETEASVSNAPYDITQLVNLQDTHHLAGFLYGSPLYRTSNGRNANITTGMEGRMEARFHSMHQGQFGFAKLHYANAVEIRDAADNTLVHKRIAVYDVPLGMNVVEDPAAAAAVRAAGNWDVRYQNPRALIICPPATRIWGRTAGDVATHTG
jgi:hypothetical protein